MYQEVLLTFGSSDRVAALSFEHCPDLLPALAKKQLQQLQLSATARPHTATHMKCPAVAHWSSFHMQSRSEWLLYIVMSLMGVTPAVACVAVKHPADITMKPAQQQNQWTASLCTEATQSVIQLSWSPPGQQHQKTPAAPQLQVSSACSACSACIADEASPSLPH